MNGRLFTLILVGLVYAATANSQAPAPVLSKTVTGVDATSDVAKNVSLDRGFVLSGRILGDASSSFEFVVAFSTATGSFGGTVSQATHRYRIELPAGTYDLIVSFAHTAGGAATIFAYTDSTAVTISSADVDHDITLPAVSTSGVTGAVSNLLMQSLANAVAFGSTSIPGFIAVEASSALDPSGNFSVQLPNGTFTASLGQLVETPAPFLTFLYSTLTPVVVSGTATLHFTAPTINLVDVTGTASFMGTTGIPASTSLEGVDITSPASQTTAFSFGSPPPLGCTTCSFRRVTNMRSMRPYPISF